MPTETMTSQAISCFMDAPMMDDLAIQPDEVKIVERPRLDGKARYSIGVTVAEGIGGTASVIFVNRIGDGNMPDEQVAEFVSDKMEPIQLANIIEKWGRAYGNALVAVEINGVGRIVCDWLAIKLRYPNMYFRKSSRSCYPREGKIGFITSMSSKHMLAYVATRWMNAGAWLPGAALRKAWPDLENEIVMAGMLALYVAHESESSLISV